MENLQDKITSFLANLDFSSNNEKCQLQFDDSKNFAQPIWLLGQMYTPDYKVDHTKHSDHNDQNQVVQELRFFKNSEGNSFINDFYSKFWFTYRKKIAPIKFIKNNSPNKKISRYSNPNRLFNGLSTDFSSASQNSFEIEPNLFSNHGGDLQPSILNNDYELTTIDTDVGWGCIIRCTQMLIAQMLTFKLLGRDWRKLKNHQNPENFDKPGFSNSCEMTSTDKRNRAIYSNILSWFLDFPGNAFGIHTLCELITEELKSDGWEPGCWLGPATAANIISTSVIVAKCGLLAFQLSDLHIYIARDSLIDPEEVYPSEPESKRRDDDQVVILIPLRLGTSEFNKEYKNCLLKLFCFQNFLGIIGGRPRKSYYFIGCQGDELIYLDPHFVQNSPSDFRSDESSYHCKKPRTLNIMKLDPTLTLGFFFKSKEEFSEFKKFCDSSRVFYRTSEVENGVITEDGRPARKNAHDTAYCPMVSFGSRKDLDKSDLAILDFDDLEEVVIDKKTGKLIKSREKERSKSGISNNSQSQTSNRSDKRRHDSEPFVLI